MVTDSVAPTIGAHPGLHLNHFRRNIERNYYEELYAWFGILVTVGSAVAGIDAALALRSGAIFALIGILVGGILGLFFGFGDVEQESRLFLRGIHRGGVILVIETADEHIRRAMDVLHQFNAEGVKICGRDAVDRYRHQIGHIAESRLARRVRWSARLLGMIMLLVLLAFFIGEGILGGDMPELRIMSISEDALMLALMMTLAGIVIAWRWEIIGAIMVIGSTLLFETVNAIASGYWHFGPLEPLFYVVGVLFLWHWWQTTGSQLEEVTGT